MKIKLKARAAAVLVAFSLLSCLGYGCASGQDKAMEIPVPTDSSVAETISSEHSSSETGSSDVTPSEAEVSGLVSSEEDTANESASEAEVSESVSSEEDTANEPPSEAEVSDIPEDVVDVASELIPLTESPAIFMVMPVASGTVVKKNDKVEIDVSNLKDGYFMVKYLQKTTKGIKLLVKGPSGTQYQYNLKTGGGYEVFPFSDGNGKYQIGVYENVGSNKYATAYTETVDVKLTDEFAPFIRPNQYVNYTGGSETVKKAAELTKNSKSVTDKISSVYNYVVANITYDKDLAASVKSGYLPDVDAVLKKGKGICFDYAAVMAAMLRSQGIPTKLVVGYAGGNIYHAWLSVYSKETGWIDNVIYFDGKSWKLMDPTFASNGKQSDDIMKFIGDGSNYTSKYIY